jgi:hypothetical protein
LAKELLLKRNHLFAKKNKNPIFKYNEQKQKCFINLTNTIFPVCNIQYKPTTMNIVFLFVLLYSSTIGVLLSHIQDFDQGLNLTKRKKIKTKAIIPELTYQIHLCNTILHLPRQGRQLPTSTHLKIP